MENPLETEWVLLAFPAGVEPTAFRLGGGRSILLSYGNLICRFILGLRRGFVKRLPVRRVGSVDSGARFLYYVKEICAAVGKNAA